MVDEINSDRMLSESGWHLADQRQRDKQRISDLETKCQGDREFMVNIERQLDEEQAHSRNLEDEIETLRAENKTLRDEIHQLEAVIENTELEHALYSGDL